MDTTLEENCRPVKKEKRSFLPELRMLSKQLEKTESDLAVFWKMNPAMLMTIKNNEIYRMNPAWEENLGYTEENLNSKRIFDIVHEEDRVKLYITLTQLREGSAAQTIILRCKHKVKDDWIYVKTSLSFDSDSDTIFCTAWPLFNKCKDCPFLT